MSLNWQKLCNAEFLIITAEDMHPEIRRWQIPDSADKICVRRETLNILASRYQRINNQATRGLCESDKALDQMFFITLQRLVKAPMGYIWDFGQWQRDPQWRRQFLLDIGLTIDIVPPLAVEGGGSSFTGLGAVSGEDELNNRFRMVKPAKAWRLFLSETVDKYPDLFSEAEVKIIHEFLRDYWEGVSERTQRRV